MNTAEMDKICSKRKGKCEKCELYCVSYENGCMELWCFKKTRFEYIRKYHKAETPEEKEAVMREYSMLEAKYLGDLDELNKYIADKKENLEKGGKL